MNTKTLKSESNNKVDAGFVVRVQRLVDMCGGISPLSRKCRLSRAVIHKYLNGESDPSRTRLVALARGTGVSLEWLATGEGAMTAEPPEPVAGGAPLDGDALRELVKRHLDPMFGRFGASRESTERCTTLFTEQLADIKNRDDQLVTLGGFIIAAANKWESDRFQNFPLPLLDSELKLFRARDPLYRLWCWREGIVPSAAANRNDMTPAQEEGFAWWLMGLHRLNADEMIQGVWEGTAGSSRRLLRFHRRPNRVFRVEQITISPFCGPPRLAEGFWTFCDTDAVSGPLAAGITFRSCGETAYLVSENSPGKSFAIFFAEAETAHHSIAVFDHTIGNADLETEFTTRLADIRNGRPTASGEKAPSSSAAG